MIGILAVDRVAPYSIYSFQFCMDYLAAIFGLEVYKVVLKIGGIESSFVGGFGDRIFGCRSSGFIFDVFIETVYGLIGCNFWAASFQCCLENWRH